MLDKVIEEIGLATSQKIAEALDGVHEKSQEDREGLVSWVKHNYDAYEKKLTEVQDGLQAAIDDLDSRRQALYVEETQQIVEKLNELEVAAARLSEIKDGEKGDQGEQGLQGEPGLDRPLLEPVYLKDDDYPKSTLGLHNGGLWISTKDAVGSPESDPHAWSCILDSMTEMSIDLQEDRSFKLSVRMATGKLIEDTFHIPFPEHKGIWEEGSYVKGDIVTKGSSFWQAMEDTSGEPPGNGWKQILSAPRGKQGPSGKSITGPQGKPGRNGRDADLPPGFVDELMAIASETKRFADGRSGAEAITSFRGFFDTTESYSSGDVVNFDGGLYLCAESTGPANSLAQGSGSWELMVGVPKQGKTAFMLWQGTWEQKAYDPGMTVRDGDWTMVCTQRTTDRASPQPIGTTYFPYTGTITPTSVSAKQVITGMRYTAEQRSQFVNGYRIYTTTDIHYLVYLVQDPLTNPIISQVADFTGTTTGWTTFNVTGGFIGVGKTIDLVLVINEPAGTPTIWSGNWDYTNPQNTAIPPAGTIVHSRNEPSEFRIDKTDNDAGDRSAELEALTVGDGIQGAGQIWTIQSIVDNGTWMNFGVSPASNGAPVGVQNFDFETVVATAIPYAEDTGYWFGSLAVSGLYGADKPYEDLTPDDNQYGIDIRVQDYSTSDDWEVVAVTEGGGSSADAQLSDEDTAWVRTSSTRLGFHEVQTTNNDWVVAAVTPLPLGQGYKGSIAVDAKRADGMGYHTSESAVLAWNDGIGNVSDHEIYVLGTAQLNFRAIIVGTDLVYEVQGLNGETWNWDITVFYREID